MQVYRPISSGRQRWLRAWVVVMLVGILLGLASLTHLVFAQQKSPTPRWF